MYSEHYGLTGRPFQLTPDPRFYFDSATHRKAMAYLGYGLTMGEGFIVVTGEIGSGKTTLVGHLMASIDPNRVNAVKIVSTAVGRDDMLRMAAQALGIEADGVDKSQLLSRIEQYLNERARMGQRTLLIVDEAQNLPVESLEELRMLSNFQVGGQSLLQIFLLGQPEFRDKINSAEMEQLRQRVIATHHLTAMLPEEVGPYIVHRMRLCGWNGHPDFTAECFAALHKETDGIPRKLNTLTSRLLLLGSVENASIIDAAMVERVVADLASELGIPEDADDVEEVAAEPRAVFEPEAAPTPVMPELAHPDYTSEPAHQPAQIFEPASALMVEPEPELEPAPAPMPQFEQDVHALDLAARVAMLEAQVEEQDAALRRVLTLLVDWVENDAHVNLTNNYMRAPAA